MVQIHNGILLRQKKKKKKRERENEIKLFATTWRDLEIIILREVSQKEKYMISLICGI